MASNTSLLKFSCIPPISCWLPPIPPLSFHPMPSDQRRKITSVLIPFHILNKVPIIALTEMNLTASPFLSPNIQSTIPISTMPTTTSPPMGFYGLLFFLINHGLCRLDLPVGSRVTIPFRPVYQADFRGRAYVLGTGQKVTPSFKAALCVEAIDGGRYTCALSVFLGDVRVWSSDHNVKFLPEDSCSLELTDDGDLQLQDGNGWIGWQTGTSGQGIKALSLRSKTGNLVLLDTENRARWQSNDFPGDVLLLGQQLNAPACLTSYPGNSSVSYSFEVAHDKLSINLNWSYHNYSYWELKSPRSLAFVRLDSRGLELYDSTSTKIGQVQALNSEPVRFLALNSQGNLGLYYYSAQQGKFEASYQAISRFCNLPLPCGSHSICAASNSCTCVQLSSGECATAPNCHSEVEMVELDGVDTILRTTTSSIINVSEETCVSSCKEDCSCEAALYAAEGRECSQYRLVAGAREVERGGFSYWVKIPKGTIGRNQDASASSRSKLLIVGGALEGLAVCVILGGFLYYYFKISNRMAPVETEPESTP